MASRPPASGTPLIPQHRSAMDRALRALLRAPHPRQRDTMATLRYRGRWNGQVAEVRTAYAADRAGRLVVLPAQAEPATWWLNLVDPTRVRVLVEGAEQGGLAFLAEPGTATHDAARSTYQH